MKAITIRQPYAQAIFAGLKHYETRSQRTHYRGDLAIHAGGKRLMLDTATCRLMDEFRFQSVAVSFHYGAVIGIARVVDCVPVESIRDSLSAVELAFGDYSDGRVAWVLDNVRAFDRPIPAKGQLGLWTWKGGAE